jgi:beta-phosphoglucomutase-like phosphatase (HAD superfamily)
MGAILQFLDCLRRNSDVFGTPSTLIDSTPGVLAAWEKFGQEFGFDPVVAARKGHGRRPMDSLGELCNLENPEQLAVRLFPL